MSTNCLKFVFLSLKLVFTEIKIFNDNLYLIELFWCSYSCNFLLFSSYLVCLSEHDNWPWTAKGITSKYLFAYLYMNVILLNVLCLAILSLKHLVPRYQLTSSYNTIFLGYYGVFRLFLVSSIWYVLSHFHLSGQKISINIVIAIKSIYQK